MPKYNSLSPLVDSNLLIESHWSFGCIITPSWEISWAGGW